MRRCGVFWHESLFTNWLPIALDSITSRVIIDSFLLVFAPLCYKEIKISSKRHSSPVFSICPIFQNCHCLHSSHLLCCLSLSLVSADIVTAGVMTTSWTWSHSFSTGGENSEDTVLLFSVFSFQFIVFYLLLGEGAFNKLLKLCFSISLHIWKTRMKLSGWTF